MRPSSRELILDAAVRVTERDGITSLTYEAVAAEAGLTKGGLLYHFPSRDDLLIAIQTHITNRWEQHLTEALGKPLSQATARERLAAYAEVAALGGASRADLAFVVESVTNPDLTQPWVELQQRWLPALIELDENDPDYAQLILGCLAADGLWFHSAVRGTTLTLEQRQRLARRIAAMVSASAN